MFTFEIYGNLAFKSDFWEISLETSDSIFKEELCCGGDGGGGVFVVGGEEEEGGEEEGGREGGLDVDCSCDGCVEEVRGDEPSCSPWKDSL